MRWLLIIAVIVAFVAALLGKRIHNRYDGILVDTRSRLVSRVQLVLWTVLAFSAFSRHCLERNRMLLAGGH